MKIVRPYAITALFLALILGASSYRLTPPQREPWEFFGNIFLNVLAELLGFSLALVLGVQIAKKAAREKLKFLSEPMLALIEKLREDKKLSPEATRRSVVALVKIVSEDCLAQDRETPQIAPTNANCRVCSLTTETKTDSKGETRCAHCLLLGALWLTRDAESKQESAPPK